MKKLFSLFTAILFAGTIIAGEVVFSGEDFTGGTANTGSAFSVTKNGVTVSSDKAYGTGEELRVYAGGKLTVTATETITNISAEFGQGTKKKFDPVTPNAKSWSITADKQIRIAELTVVINGEGGSDNPGEGGESGEGGDVTPSGDVLTCAEAVAIAQNKDGKTYTAQGYVTAIKTEYSTQYGNISFWMADTQNGGEVLQAFRCVPESASKLPEVGDLVQVTGKLTTFKDTPEFDAACTCVIIEKGEGGESGEGGDVTPSGDVLTCAEAVAIAQNKDGKTYTAQGYVTAIKTEYSTQYGNISFWMADTQNGGEVLQAFRCVPESASKLPEIGDLVQVTGKLTTFKDTPEFDAACTCVIIKKGEGGESGEGGDITPSGDILTCTEAVAIAQNKDGKTYTAQGYVTGIKTEYSTQFGNISFWMADTQNGGEVLQAFRCVPESAGKLPEVGDLVQVTGKLTTYKDTPEFDEECTCVIIEKGEGGESGEGEGTGDDAINIDVAFAEVTLFSDDEIGDYWQVNLYKDYDEETDIVTYPDLYVIFPTKSKTAIAGTHPAKDLEIYLDTDEETEIEQKSSSDLKITLVSGTTYRYQLTFVGDDDNNYKLDVTLETEAYDGTNDYAEITLNETPEEGSAVENTTLSTQPVKTIQNGQLIIIANGIKYNVLGAQME